MSGDDELVAARKERDREVARRQVLAKANNLLDRELFRARLTGEILKAAEEGTDLDGFCVCLFELITRVVRVRWLGIAAGEGRWFHPAASPVGQALLEDVQAGRGGSDGAFVFTFQRGGQTLGHLVCLPFTTAFPASELELMQDLARRATPILERNLLIRRLEELATFQADFAHMLGHDLRSPLTGVIASLSALALPELAANEALRGQMIKTALDSAHLANAMIGDLLDVAKSEAGKVVIDRDPVDLAALAATALELQQPVAGMKGLALVLEAPDDLPRVAGEETKLMRVIANLTSNALKYTQRGGVLVRLWVEGDEVHMVVADTGIGVPAEAQPHLFEKFFQVGGRQRKKLGGTGLGLTFCKQMVEAHGGRLWLASPSTLAADHGLAPKVPQPGTAFHLSLPVMAG
ncbi:MAG: two-component hybrid sensor and regulator [Cyanobacteria bacterium RYN_339]|nr:two-component hybrid sensor and regulator [Cyanobacteria bacterium RYN_339]